MPASRYAAAGGADYSHRLHAGNVGDVWKHCVLIAVLRAVAAEARHVAYVETHAGDGRYRLHPTGEWTEGVGRLWAEPARGGVVADYLELCRRLGAGDGRPTTYPGSPAFARAALGDDAELGLWEQDQRTAEHLTAAADAHPRTHVTVGDGIAALDGALHATRADATVALIDPSWGRKSDWQSVPDALVRASHRTPRACFLLWYPVKSLTRPNAMMERLVAAGVEGVAAELVTTPLAHQRQRLNGSGVLLVGAPAAAVDALGAAAAEIGGRCATFPGTWSFRLRSFAGKHGIC